NSRCVPLILHNYTTLSYFSLITRPPPRSTLFPYTTLFRSCKKFLSYSYSAFFRPPSDLQEIRVRPQLNHVFNHVSYSYHYHYLINLCHSIKKSIPLHNFIFMSQFVVVDMV